MIIAVPYENAFVTEYNSLSYSEMTSTQKNFFVMNTVLDIFFWMDIILNFLTAYFDRVTNLWVDDLPSIGYRYITTWFALDLICVFPFNEVLTSTGAGAKNIELLRFFKFARLLKMLRAVKANRIIARMMIRYEFNQDAFKMLRNTVIILGSFHLVVCVWAGVACKKGEQMEQDDEVRHHTAAAVHNAHGAVQIGTTLQVEHFRLI